jgi:hypothetical protein
VAICASVTLVYGVAWRLATRRLMRATEGAEAVA